MSGCAGKFAFGAVEWPGVAKLVEECGEFLQVAGKLMMTNGDPVHWSGDLRSMFIEELADVRAASIFVARTCLSADEKRVLTDRVAAKIGKFERWHADPSDDAPVSNGCSA